MNSTYDHVIQVAFRVAFASLPFHREFWKEDYVKKPVLFWKVVSGEAPGLSAMAIRVFSTPANSVPSERSFSAMNFLQDEYRSRLSAERTDMLTFIYMNSKVLRRQPSEPAPTWYNITEEQEEELENLAYEYLCQYGGDSGEDESSWSTYTYLAYLGSIYVGPYNHVIWYLWYFENSSLVNPIVYISVVNTIYTQPDP